MATENRCQSSSNIPPPSPLTAHCIKGHSCPEGLCSGWDKDRTLTGLSTPMPCFSYASRTSLQVQPSSSPSSGFELHHLHVPTTHTSTAPCRPSSDHVSLQGYNSKSSHKKPSSYFAWLFFFYLFKWGGEKGKQRAGLAFKTKPPSIPPSLHR